MAARCDDCGQFRSHGYDVISPSGIVWGIDRVVCYSCAVKRGIDTRFQDEMEAYTRHTTYGGTWLDFSEENHVY